MQKMFFIFFFYNFPTFLVVYSSIFCWLTVEISALGMRDFCPPNLDGGPRAAGTTQAGNGR
jgi:hypothetical protein